MSHVDDILARLGGAEAAARLTGVGGEAVRKWRQARAIPSKHWAAIVAATGLSFADLQPPTASAPMPQPPTSLHEMPAGATAALVLADGTVAWGRGFGAHSAGRVGEVCFNTGMTGYQETLTDPSYAGQIVTFTFPHIGNAGANPEDMEATNPATLGLVVKQDVTEPSNWRAAQPLDTWLQTHGLPGLAGADTRALTLRIRDGGAPHAVLAYPADGRFDIAALQAQARAWPGLEGMDLARQVSCTQSYGWDEGTWSHPDGFAHPAPGRHHVVAVDYGAKRNILRSLVSAGCRVTVVPADTGAADILRHQPDGVFLSNGPGDPAATAAYAVPAIQGVLDAGVPVFGICLGHQLLALALGARTYKLARGHRGANQPVKDLATGRVEITSQNHGFAVADDSLPDGVRVTHTSLFDGSNEGIACDARRAFSVQYHPEASPGPSDSGHLFGRFVGMMAHPGSGMPDSGSFREVARSVTVSYPIPFLFASLLGFALSCFGMALLANGALSTLLAGTGIFGAVVSVGLAAYAVIKRPELLRSERYSLMHRALDVIGNTELDAGARREVSSTMTDLLAENVPRRTKTRTDISNPGR